MIKASGNGGSGPRDERPAENKATLTASVITAQPTGSMACLQAGTTHNTFYPQSAASFPDDACNQHMIKASGNGGPGQKHDHPAANPVTRAASVITTQPTASLPVSDP